jgi:hypothetical protein
MHQLYSSVSCDFKLVVQDLIPEVIPIQVCHEQVQFSSITELWKEIENDLNDTRHDYNVLPA